MQETHLMHETSARMMIRLEGRNFFHVLRRRYYYTFDKRFTPYQAHGGGPSISRLRRKYDMALARPSWFSLFLGSAETATAEIRPGAGNRPFLLVRWLKCAWVQSLIGWY